ncbi:MAG: aldehyde dehydrogenase family protein [Clostridiales Family XIII bacterium]|jgi:succinate-semialdehyde dehydrogenase/glutarate-semialdehyde dehydrogenase|nr:aldehyde dehydrogenase family protein [Clostridiales Family XIII bacterium]
MAETLNVINPETGGVMETLVLKSKREMADMVESAAAAQKIWGATPIYERVATLNRFAGLIDANNGRIAKLIATESGKPIAQASVETEDGANILRGNAERAKHLYGDVYPATGPGLENDVVFTRREPLGVVACIAPFNFPMEITFHKISPALAMGNTVLLKAPSAAPLAILGLADLAAEAGLPEDVLQIFVCDRRTVDESIVANPKVNAISMTGSTASGVHLMEKGASTLKRMFLELGGNDPFLIFDDANTDRAADEMITRMHNNGQICCAPKRFFVHRPIYDAVLEKVIGKCKMLPRGSALEEASEITTLVTEDAAKKVERQIAHCLEQGATLKYGGVRDGARIEPTVLGDVTSAMDVAKDMEIFGPVIPMIAFDTEEEAIEMANASVYGLSAAILTEDLARSFRVAARLEAGAVVQNGSCVYRHLDQPFGGVKMSGIGREGVGVSPEEYSRVKTHVIKEVLR